MPTLNLSIGVSGLGGSITRNTPRTADGGGTNEIGVAVGEAGSLTTRSTDTTGTITMSDAGHGITTGQNVDVFWSGGVQYDVTVGTVSGTSVPISGGSGDVLPSSSTAVVVSPRVTFNCAIDGDELSLLSMQQFFADQTITTKTHIQFLDSGSAEIAEIDVDALTPRVYDITGGDSNPFTGNPITSAVVSNGSTTGAGTFKLLWVQDSTP